MKPLIILIAVLSIFIASEVRAGCAWVLWTMTRSEPLVGWSPLDSTETIADCQKLLKEYAKGLATADGGTVTFGYSTAVVTAKSGGTMFKCLPDTVDPRGKKE